MNIIYYILGNYCIPEKASKNNFFDWFLKLDNFYKRSSDLSYCIYYYENLNYKIELFFNGIKYNNDLNPYFFFIQVRINSHINILCYKDYDIAYKEYLILLEKLRNTKLTK